MHRLLLAAVFAVTGCAALKFTLPADAQPQPRVVEGSFNSAQGMVNMKLGEWTIPSVSSSAQGMSLNFGAFSVGKQNTTFTFTVHRAGQPVAPMQCEVKHKGVEVYRGMFSVNQPKRAYDCRGPGFTLIMLEREAQGDYVGQVTRGPTSLEVISETAQSGSVRRPMAAVTYRQQGHWAASVTQSGTGYLHASMPPDDEAAVAWASMAFYVAREQLNFR